MILMTADAVNLDVLKALFQASSDGKAQSMVLIIPPFFDVQAFKTELFAAQLEIAVVEARNAMSLESGGIYLVPQHQNVILEGKVLQLEDKFDASGASLSFASTPALLPPKLEVPPGLISTLIENITDIFIIFDLELERVVWNSGSIFNALGYTSEYILALGDQIISSLVHPEDLPGLARHLAEVSLLDDGAYKNHEFRLRHTDGSWRWFLTYDRVFKRSSSGQVIQFLAMLIDITKTKVAEQEKAEALAFVELITASVPDVVTVYDYEAEQVVWSNRRLAEVLGYSPEQIQVMPAPLGQHFTAPDSKTQTEEAREIMAFAADGEVKTFSYKFIAADGKPRWYSSNKVVFKRAADGSVLQHLAVNRDVTAQVLAEQALQEREQKLIQAQRIAKLGDFTWDVKSGEITWSTALYELMGYTPDEPINYAKITNQMHHPEDKKRVAAWLAEALRSGSDVLPPNEYRVLRKNGDAIHVRAAGVIERIEGQATKVFATVQDITELRQAQEDLRYQAFVLSSISEAVVTTDMDYIVNSWNEAAENLYGYTAEEAIGQPIQKLLQRREGDTTLAEVKSSLETKGSWSGESIQTAKDGHRLVVNSAISLMYGEDGSAIGSVAVHHDLSERIKAEYETLQRQELARTNESLEQFAYIASHDLQEPLRTISNYSILLSEEYGEHFDELGLKSLDFITSATERMSMLIKDLLDYSRLGRNPQFERVDLNQVVRDIQADLASLITEKQVRVDVEHLPIVQGFATELRLLMQNLISNAIKFHRKGVAPELHICAREDEAFWYIVVQDNGIGIARQYQERIFHLFQRLHNQRAYRGTGIGLAQCKRIAELHGGQILVESVVSEGSTFTVSLLKKSAENPTENPTP